MIEGEFIVISRFRKDVALRYKYLSARRKDEVFQKFMMEKLIFGNYERNIPHQLLKKKIGELMKVLFIQMLYKDG
jgi:hypothetical protein